MTFINTVGEIVMGGVETDPLFTAWLATIPLSAYVPTTRTLTINGTSFDLSANRTWTIPADQSFGTTTQIPYMNAGGTDFLYSPSLTFGGLTGNGLLINRTISSELVSTSPLYVNEVHTWTGTCGLILGGYISLQDKRVTTAGFGGGDLTYGLNLSVSRLAPASTGTAPDIRGINFLMTDTGTYSAGCSGASLAGMYFPLTIAPTVNRGAGTFTYTAKNCDALINNAFTPTITSGTYIQDSYGYSLTGTGHTVGTHTIYDFYTSVTGGDVHYGFYNNGTGNNLLGNDSVLTYFGTGLDATITYDGTNLVVNPKVVGTGYLSVLGEVTSSSGFTSTGATKGFYRVVTLAGAPTFPSLNITENYNYTGGGEDLVASNIFLTDSRILNGGKTNSLTALYFCLDRAGTTTVASITSNALQGYAYERGIYNYSGSMSVNSTGFANTLAFYPTINIGAGNTVTANVVGYSSNLSPDTPTLTSGSLIETTKLFSATGIGSTVGTHTIYDFYTFVTGGDVHYGFYNAGSGNNLLGIDNVYSAVGTALDSGFYYDGTNTIWKNYVGTGYFDLQMALKTTGLTVTNLTSSRIPFAGTGGLLGDSANFTYGDSGTFGLTIKSPSTYNIYAGRTHSSSLAGAGLYLREDHTWTGSATSVEAVNCSVLDQRIVNGGKNDFVRGMSFGVTRTAPASTIKNPNMAGIDFSITDTGTQLTGSVTSVVDCVRGILVYAPVLNSGATFTASVSLFSAAMASGFIPTITSGTYVQNSYGYKLIGTAHTVGTHTMYDFYSSLIGADVHYCFYNDGTGHNLLGKDSVKTYFGSGLDASLYYDGTDFFCNPKDVGTGYFRILGGAKVGDGGTTNYAEFDTTGHLTFKGTARPWRDELSDAVMLQQQGPGVSRNATEGTVDFVYNATYNATFSSADALYLNIQLNHDKDLTASIYPHIHWIQEKNYTPNFLIEYRWQKNGGAKTTAWTKLVCTTLAFTYVSGSLNQISYSSAISVPVGTAISDIVQFRIFRDTGNASGSFAGDCPYNTGGNATASLTAFDVHFMINSLGSTDEYTK
jgi:hypothetical protein